MQTDLFRLDAIIKIQNHLPYIMQSDFHAIPWKSLCIEHLIKVRSIRKNVCRYLSSLYESGKNTCFVMNTGE